MLILKLLVFAIPVTYAAILHMVVVRFDLLSSLKYPLDFGKTFRGQRIFGDHKTFRGLIAMWLLSIVGTFLLYRLTLSFPSIAKYNVIDFTQYSPWLIGSLLGLAYIIAELPNSFFKRQLNIAQGKRGSFFNILMDQFDSPFLCLLVMIPFSSIDWLFFLLGSVFFLALHLFFNLLLYLLGLRKNPF